MMYHRAASEESTRGERPLSATSGESDGMSGTIGLADQLRALAASLVSGTSDSLESTSPATARGLGSTSSGLPSSSRNKQATRPMASDRAASAGTSRQGTAAERSAQRRAMAKGAAYFGASALGVATDDGALDPASMPLSASPGEATQSARNPRVKTALLRNVQAKRRAQVDEDVSPEQHAAGGTTAVAPAVGTRVPPAVVSSGGARGGRRGDASGSGGSSLNTTSSSAAGRMVRPIGHVDVEKLTKELNALIDQCQTTASPAGAKTTAAAAQVPAATAVVEPEPPTQRSRSEAPQEESDDDSDRSDDAGGLDGIGMQDAEAEVSGVLGRCAEEFVMRAENTEPDDGVQCLRIANPRHPMSSERSRCSLAVRELFTLLMARLWCAEDYEVVPDAEGDLSSDDEGAGAESSPFSEKEGSPLGPEGAGSSRKPRKPRTFAYPGFKNGAGAVTAEGLAALMGEGWSSLVVGQLEEVAAKLAAGGGPAKGSFVRAPEDLLHMAAAAPLGIIRRTLSQADAEGRIPCQPFDPVHAAHVRQQRLDASIASGQSAEFHVDAADGLESMTIDVLYRPGRTAFHDKAATQLKKGTIIANRYRILSLLGEATFSRAVRCDDFTRPLASPDGGFHQVCLKVINNSKDFFDQSLDEIRNLKRLAQVANDRFEQAKQIARQSRSSEGATESPTEKNALLSPSRDTADSVEVHDALMMVTQYDNGVDAHRIISLRDCFYYSEHMIIVLDLLRANLYDFGRSLRKAGKPRYFTLNRVRSVVHQVMTGLALVHDASMIHNDLKPENILIESVEKCEVRVIDFGSSCFRSDKLSSYVQSRSYRAPEVFLGADYDGRIDVWSAGCIAVELLTQDVLFHSSSIPEMLARMVETCGAVPNELLRRSRHADTLFTRDGVIFAAQAEGDDVRHELYADGAKPFTAVRHVLRAEADAIENDLGLPPVYSEQFEQTEDGLECEPTPPEVVDDGEEDGVYLFLPCHSLPPINRMDLGTSWIELGHAMKRSIADAALRHHRNGDVSEEQPSSGDGEEPYVPVDLVLRFLVDVARCERSFDYRSRSSSAGRRVNRLNHLLSTVGELDLETASRHLLPLRQHLREQLRQGQQAAGIGGSEEPETTSNDPFGTTADEAVLAGFPSGLPIPTVPASILTGTAIQPLLFLHFVRLTILLDPQERPTAAQLLRHPFLLVLEIADYEIEATNFE